MDYQKAIETLQDIHDVAEVRIKSGDTRGVVYIPSEKIKDIESALSAMEELEHYKQLGTLEEVRAAVVKQTAVSRVIIGGKYYCPKCSRNVMEKGYCKCGQKLY